MNQRFALLSLLLFATCNGAAAFSAPSLQFGGNGNDPCASYGKRKQSTHTLFSTNELVKTEECVQPNNDDTGSNMPDTMSRRRWLSSMFSATSGAASMLVSQQPAVAAPPLTAEVADNTAARLERALRPKPAKVLRPRMNLDFAVLLMRSSYNAVDEIDIVAMDQFQRDFFLIRQAEYQPYAASLGAGAMQQGDLADPNYFDFISFAQYSTISREIVNPPSLFEEQQPVEVGEGEPQKFDTVVVKRDPTLTNSVLPIRHTELVGNAIYDKLIEKFGDTASAIPKIEQGSRPDANAMLAAIKQMVNLFVVQGFAWDGNASISNDGQQQQFTITFTSPATLWSGQSLKAKKAVLINDFALKTARAMASRAGYSVVNASVKYANNQEITTFTIV